MSQGSLLGLSRVAGGVAGLVGLAVAELGAGLIARDGSPVADLATVISWWLPSYWGSGTGKTLLMVLVVIAWLLLAAFAGQLELRRRHFSLFVILPVAATTLLAISTQVGPGALGYVPAVLGLAAIYLTLRLLISQLRRPPGSLEPLVAERRNFLKTAGLITMGGIIVAGVGRILIEASNKVAEVREKILLPEPASPAPTIAAGTDLNLAGLTPYLNTNESFYRIDTALQLPVIDPDTWRLQVTGLVENELTLTYSQLLERPLTEHVTTLACMSNQVGGALVGNAVWLGIPVRDLLAEAVPLSGATMVLSTSQDGWSAATPLSMLTDPDVAALLAVGMNGDPLPPEHGFPVRMVVPGLYGDVSATKWLTQLKVTTDLEDNGYWAQKGWAPRGPVKIASRIDVPTRSMVVEPGQVNVAGVAWAPGTGIKAVHVQINEDAWRKAELAETTGPDSWRQWVYQWEVDEPGDYTLTVRATASDGQVQSSKVAPPFPSGASGLHSVLVRVRPN
ncbi:MAG: molybdopterin-dependent oxidoreductase [Microlunatus sp.]